MTIKALLEEQMNHSMKKTGIPTSVKIFTWLLICAGYFFFYVYTFNPSISFPKANLDTYSAQMGFASTGVRIIGGVFILLLCVLFDKPQWLFITLVGRVFVELGDVTAGLILDGVTPATFALLVLASLEIWAASKLWKLH